MRQNQQPGGGGGTPGGSTTELQYNNAGAFGGTSGLTWDGTNLLFATSQELRFRNSNTKIFSSADTFLRLYGTGAVRVQSPDFTVIDIGGTRTLFEVADVASSVNYLGVLPSATTNPVRLLAVGTDSNISLKLEPKGTGGLIVGNGTAGTDYTLTFDGETNDGVLTWMEDEDYFQFSDDALFATTEKLYFRDTDIFIHSASDGNLLIQADTLVTIGVAGTTELGDGTLRILRPNTDLKIDLGDGSHRFNDIYSNTLVLSSKVTTYNAITTVGQGIPSVVAVANLTAQGAAITATTIYAVPAIGAGFYRVSWVATVTRAATTSSVLGGTNGFRLTYTDADDSVVKTSAPTTISHQTSAGNTTATQVSGCLNAYCKASTNLQYAFDYTSVGGTSMQFNLHISVEPM